MARIKQHLAECANCARRLKASEELLGRLFGAIEPVAPDASQRVALLQKVAAQPILLRPRPKGGWRVALVGLAAALILGLTTCTLLLLGQLQTVSSQQAENQKLLELAVSPDSLVWLMTAPDVPFDRAAPRARMFARAASDFYLVTAVNFKPAPAGQVYRFWYVVQDTQTRQGGSLVLDGKGQASLQVQDSARAATDITSCFVTLESLNNPTDRPTNPPLLIWKRP